MCQHNKMMVFFTKYYHGLRMKPIVRRAALCVGLSVLGWNAYREFQRSPHYADIPSYRRVDWWVISARCAQSKRVVLVACGARGELYPIEDVSPTDDRGHALLL